MVTTVRRRSVVTAVNLAAATLAALALWRLQPGPVDYELALQFTAALFLVNLLDLWMPYGEPVPVDTALVVGCVVLGGVSTAILASFVARMAVFVARRGAYTWDQVSDLMSRRFVSLLVCLATLTMTGVESWPPLYQSLAIAAVVIGIELVLAQLQAAPILDERVSQLLVGNVELQGSLLAAQLSIAALIVITYDGMRVWGLVLMTLLLLLMRQSLFLVLEIRQAYRGTIEALVAAIEIQDPGRRGHARRVSRIARSIGLKLGVRGRQLERLGYAALLHDVDMIGVDPGGDSAAAEASQKHAADVVADVGFLSQVTPILLVCDGGGVPSTPGGDDEAALAAMVAVASDIDDADKRGAEVPGSACRRVAASPRDERIEKALRAAREAGLLDAGLNA